MKNLEELSWEKVKVFDDSKTLIIATTNSSVDSIRIKEGSSKIVPYISRTNNNNGISQFVSRENYEFGSDVAGSITVGLDTQTAFYQPYRYITGQNIHVVTGKHLNKDLALFYIPILKKQMIAKFNWGGNGATLGRMKSLEALVPTDQDGVQDYKFMTKYSKYKQKELIAKYKTFLVKQIKEIDFRKIPHLEEKHWIPISIYSVFQLIRGRENNMALLNDGKMPLISAKKINNGLKGFVSTPNRPVQGNCISLNNDGDGGAGLAYYQPYEMALDTHVTALIPKEKISKWSMLFISECISKLHGFFGHGLSISNKRAEKIQIMLPVTDAGQPDFEYMEQYAKNMMLKKYKQYLSYLERKGMP